MQDASLLTPIPSFYQNFTEEFPSFSNLSVENKVIFRSPTFISLTESDWDEMSLEIKVETVIMTCLQLKEQLSLKNILNQVVTDKKVANQLLPIYEERALQNNWQGFFKSWQKRLLTWTFIRKTLLEQKNTSYITLLNDCLLDFNQDSNFTIQDISETRLHHLGAKVNRWINWPKATTQLYNALETFKATLHRYHQAFPFHFLKNVFHLSQFLPLLHIHEAALIDRKLTQGDMLNHNGTLSQTELEHTYLTRLAEASHERDLLDQLFQPISLNNNQTQPIYFNGMSFKNAKNYYFADLVNCTEVEAIPEYHALNFSQKMQLMRSKFFLLGENTDYAIGSLAHSLASILQRIFYYQIISFAHHHYSEKELMDYFKGVEHQWLIHKDYPINPRFLLALHLAESNNLILPKNNTVKLKTIFNYLNKQWAKVLVEPPFFNKTQAIVSILLEQLDMPMTEIETKRYYVIIADNMNLSPTYFGTPVEQFLKLVDWIGPTGKMMYYQGKSISPRLALEKVEENFNQGLANSSWVLKKARDNLYEQQKIVTNQAVQQEAQRIAQNYAIETEQHRQWMRGIQTWINTIPIIGSLNTLREGIQDKSISEIIGGMIALSLDALDLLSGGKEKTPAEFEETLSEAGLSLREHLTLKTIHYCAQEVQVSSHELFVDTEIQVHDDPFFIKISEYFPDNYPELAQRVWAGEALTWQNYPVIHLADENRIVPIYSQGSYYREISWHTGEIDPRKHLIFKDSITQKYYASGFLKGGSDDLETLSFIEVKERLTVQTVERIFSSANDYLIHDFPKFFMEQFHVRVDKRVVSWTDASRFYENIYQKSPTFRRLFNQYYQHASSEVVREKWTLIVQNDVVPRTDFINKIVYLASNDEISRHYYVSEEDDLVSSKPEQVYLHELLHALTGEYDPIKTHSLRHRGPIVYLSDKILSEAGYFFQQRIMYRRFSDSSAHKAFEEERLQWEKHRKQARYLALQENDYLDDLIDKTVPISQYSSVFGEQLMDRFTVVEMLEIREKIAEVLIDLDLASMPFRSKFKRFFVLEDEKEFSAIIEFYEKLYIKSQDFYILFNKWAAHFSEEDQPWQFELDKNRAYSELPQKKRVHCLNDLTHKIYIFEDGTEYLSPKGLIPVNKIRQLTFEMVQLLTGLPEPLPEIALRNRGAVVVLTDKILQQAQFIYEKQLVYALVTEENLLRKRQLLTYQLEANRAISLEDRLIESLSYDEKTCQPVCRKKRSDLNTSIIYLPLFFHYPIVLPQTQQKINTASQSTFFIKNVQIKNFSIWQEENTEKLKQVEKTPNDKIFFSEVGVIANAI